MNHYTLKGAYTTYAFEDVRTRSTYDFSDRWNANPLSDKAYINANLAGFKKAKYEQYTVPDKKKVEVPEFIVSHSTFLPKDYPITYPCSTVYPTNSSYKTNKFIVEQP